MIEMASESCRNRVEQSMAYNLDRSIVNRNTIYARHTIDRHQIDNSSIDVESYIKHKLTSLMVNELKNRAH